MSGIAAFDETSQPSSCYPPLNTKSQFFDIFSYLVVSESPWFRHLLIMSRSTPIASARSCLRSHYQQFRPFASLPSHRFASSSTSTSSSASSPPSSSTVGLPLTWPEYLSLRRQRRLWSTLTTVPTTLGGLFAGGSYFANLEGDPSQLIMGVEPM